MLWALCSGRCTAARSLRPKTSDNMKPFAGRIIAMAEQNMAHRQSMETTLVSKEYGLRTRGQWLAFAALLAILVVVAFTFWLGQPIAAGLLGGATIVAIVGMFLGRDRAREEAKQTQVPEKPGRAKSRRK